MVEGIKSMDRLNIFETIRKAQPGRTEPFHSQFLADALIESLKPSQDRSLFEKVWQLTAPNEWCPPTHARVEAEVVVNYGQRVDICIFDTSNHRIIGIEVKTTDASAEHGQLQSYRDGIEKKYRDWTVSIAYITPFNRERASDAADSLLTIRVFEEFLQESPDAKHVSWLDVADIPWDGRAIWEQHRSYIREHISSQGMLQIAQGTRSFHDFFGEPADEFWTTIRNLGFEPTIRGVTVELSKSRCLSSIAEELVHAFEILIRNGDGIARHVQRRDKFPEFERMRFLESKYSQVHAALFDLSDRFSYVWVEGKRDYGIRVTHKNHPGGGVSLVRSHGEGRLGRIGMHR